MHYFPSTFEEIRGFLIEYRQRQIMAGEKDPQLACIMGRFQRREFEHSPMFAEYRYRVAGDFTEECDMIFFGYRIHFDDDAAWRFDIGTKKPGTASP